jgi:hypothetical protein
MLTYFDYVGSETYMKELKEFFLFNEETKKFVNRENVDVNWYFIKENNYWQCCMNENEKHFWESQGRKVMQYNSRRMWVYNDEFNLKMFDGAKLGYKE